MDREADDSQERENPSSGWLQTILGMVGSAVLGGLISALLVLAVFGPAEDERSIAFQELISLRTYLDSCEPPTFGEYEEAIERYNDAQAAFRETDFASARTLIADAQDLAVAGCGSAGAPPFDPTA